jgi:glycosyltransferase involved in cell wall biosynthesis
MIRLYGLSIGNGSFARVTAGMRGALAAMGLLDGFVPLDAYDPDTPYEGARAPIAVYVGIPSNVSIVQNIGWHAKRWMLLPPNSSWVPTEMLEYVAEHVTGLLAPTKWAEGVLQGYAAPRGLEVSVWRHGVDEGFQPNAESYEGRRTDYAQGDFRVLHMASTSRERKGTRELIEGWMQAVRRRALGPRPVLHLIVEDFSGKYLDAAEAAANGDPALLGTLSWGEPRANMDVATCAVFYQHYHVVAQPSRGEAFGMVPLEARSCGVPIVATNCTGHSASISPGAPGVVIVTTGPDEPIDDGPGARGPSLKPDDVSRGLIEAYQSWPELQEAAHAFAPTLAHDWSWDRVTREWISAYVTAKEGST